ncbi:MAG: hypothetical protein KDC52_18645, partial [Ignavibacteriae bacterium]|nr:hypothetical protein [Ignavibacteriota bacterium]
KWSDINKIEVNQSAIISSADVDEVITGKILSIGNNVKTAKNFQYVLVTVISEDKTAQLKSGLYVDCKIECGSETALDILSDFLKPIFK